MAGQKISMEGKLPFNDPERIVATFDAAMLAKLAMVAGDVALVLDDAGRILDMTADAQDFPDSAAWVGRDWLDLVTVESRPKVMEMLASARKGAAHPWRQVNHPTANGDLPVRYTLVPTGQGGSIAFGRTMRETSALQQRLLQAQQGLERDYLRMRQVEARYRMLFDQSHEAIIIADGESYRIREANPAAHRVLDAQPGALVGAKVAACFERPGREQLIAFLGSAIASSSVSMMEAEAPGGVKLRLSASGFRQRNSQFVLLRLAGTIASQSTEHSATLDIVEAMPDAFVLTDAAMIIEVANGAFVELVGAASAEEVKGRPLGDFVGRPGIDMDLIDAQLAKHDIARNVATVVGVRDGFDGEPVELAAVRVMTPTQRHGFVIRPIARRLRDLPHADNTPRSVTQLTELVGRMALRDIVRESTDLIERLCIEAALDYTSNNRASAAEILGLSRQSLYSKLHRYGLGNPVDCD